MLHIARHDVHFLFGQRTRTAPVRHALRRTVVDEGLQVFGTALQRDVGGQRLASCALAQYAVAAGATFEVNLFADLELFLAHRWRFRIQRLHHLDAADRRRTTNLHAPFFERFRLGFLRIYTTDRQRDRRRHQQPFHRHTLLHSSSPSGENTNQFVKTENLVFKRPSRRKAVSSSAERHRISYSTA